MFFKLYQTLDPKLALLTKFLFLSESIPNKFDQKLPLPTPMKPTLVLGLALAANAMAADQADNELFVAPTDKFSRDLAQRFPGKIMFDEVADDELYHGFPARENFSSHEEWLRATRRYDAEEADNELLVRPVVSHIAADDEELFVAPQGKLVDLAKKYPGMIMFDEEADDELLLLPFPQKDKPKAGEEWQKYLPTIPRKVLKTDEEYRQFLSAADDELRFVDKDPLSKDKIHRFISPHFDKETRTWNIGPAQIASFDDDENYVYHKTKKPIEQADDELALRIVRLPFAEHLAYAFDDDELAVKIVNPPATENGNVAYDNEFAFISRAPRVFVDRSLVKPAKNTTSEALVRDDEADDELAYLGHLLDERAQPRSFDEFKKKREKPSHVKDEERAQMKSELSKMKRKLRPVVDETPLTQN